MQVKSLKEMLLIPPGYGDHHNLPCSFKKPALTTLLKWTLKGSHESYNTVSKLNYCSNVEKQLGAWILRIQSMWSLIVYLNTVWYRHISRTWRFFVHELEAQKLPGHIFFCNLSSSNECSTQSSAPSDELFELKVLYGFPTVVLRYGKVPAFSKGFTVKL